MIRAGLIALALLVTSCAGQQLDPIMMAEQACNDYIDTVVDSGACDYVDRLDNCPAFMRAMRECEKLLDAAKRVR